MIKRSQKLFINDIVEILKSINDFINEMSFESFIIDDKTISAVIRKIEIIGKAAKNISDDIILK